MSMEEDKDGFAAEYVLGTLDAEERAHRTTELRLSLMKHRAVHAPRQHGSRHEYQQTHAQHSIAPNPLSLITNRESLILESSNR